MQIDVCFEQKSKRSKRLALSSSTDSLNMEDHIRVRRVPVLMIDGERFTKQELRGILRAAKQCKCGECFDCAVAIAAQRAGY